MRCRKRRPVRKRSRRGTGAFIGFNAGPPMIGAGYNAYVQIFQTLDSVVLLNEMVHDARIIPVGDQPAFTKKLRQWKGVSKGRWEGQTFIVETSGFRPEGTGTLRLRGLGNIPDENLRLTERFSLMDADTLLYEYTVDDPTVWTKPWSVSQTMWRTEQPVYRVRLPRGKLRDAGHPRRCTPDGAREIRRIGSAPPAPVDTPFTFTVKGTRSVGIWFSSQWRPHVAYESPHHSRPPGPCRAADRVGLAPDRPRPRRRADNRQRDRARAVALRRRQSVRVAVFAADRSQPGDCRRSSGRLGMGPEGAETGKWRRSNNFSGTAIMIDNVVYISTMYTRVVALDAENGTELWVYDPEAYRWGQNAQVTGFTHRGVTPWWDGDQLYLFLASRHRLIKLDGKTGKPVPAFGGDGEIELSDGARWEGKFNKLHLSNQSPSPSTRT